LDQSKADVIQSKYSGGGEHSCLQEMLALWNRSTNACDRNWETIVDALKEIKASKVIEDIEDKHLKW